MPNYQPRLKRLERGVVLRFASIAATMLVYWFVVIELFRRYDMRDSQWLMFLVFFLPLPLVVFVFFHFFHAGPYRRGLRLYREGNFRDAEAELRHAMENSLHVGAAVTLGGMYLRGDGVLRDPDAGVGLYRLAMSNYFFVREQLPEMMRAGGLARLLGRRILREQTETQLAEWMREMTVALTDAAAAGNAAAMQLLADIHTGGFSAGGGAEKGAELARRAAAAAGDSLEARTDLALRLINGKGASREQVAEGMSLMRSCRERGNAYAAWFLALQYAGGDNPHIPVDCGEAAASLRALLTAEQAGGDTEKIGMFLETAGDALLKNDCANILTEQDCLAMANALIRAECPTTDKIEHWRQLASGQR